VHRLDVCSCATTQPASSGTPLLFLYERDPTSGLAMQIVETSVSLLDLHQSHVVGQAVSSGSRHATLLQSNYGPRRGTLSRLLSICSHTEFFKRGRLSAARKRGQEFSHAHGFHLILQRCCKGSTQGPHRCLHRNHHRLAILEECP
jgi:hypothetical protein